MKHIWKDIKENWPMIVLGILFGFGVALLW